MAVAIEGIVHKKRYARRSGRVVWEPSPMKSLVYFCPDGPRPVVPSEVSIQVRYLTGICQMFIMNYEHRKLMDKINTPSILKRGWFNLKIL